MPAVPKNMHPTRAVKKASKLRATVPVFPAAARLLLTQVLLPFVNLIWNKMAHSV